VYNFAQCVQCGARWEIPGKHPNFKARCESCRAVRVERIDYDGEECIPWGGDFDRNDNPMLDGEYYLRGYRTCFHRDCVRVSHIIAFSENV
jgi:hypothetical protein